MQNRSSATAAATLLLRRSSAVRVAHAPTDPPPDAADAEQMEAILQVVSDHNAHSSVSAKSVLGAGDQTAVGFQHGIRARALDPTKVVHYRFDGKSYLQWATLISSYLDSHDLLDYVTGEAVRPPAPGEPAFVSSTVAINRWQQWRSRDADCRNILQANVVKELLFQITPCSTAAGMWSTLKDSYQISNPQSIMTAKKQLTSFKMTKGINLEAFIKQHDFLCHQLQSLGKPVDDCDRLVTFLDGLSDRFAFLKTAMLQNKQLTYKDALESTRSHEASQSQPQAMDRPAPAVAYSAVKPAGKSSNQKPTFVRPQYCGRCGFSNHKQPDCKVDLTTITCHKCDKQGHGAAICPLRRSGSSNHAQANKPKVLVASATPQKNEQPAAGSEFTA